MSGNKSRVLHLLRYLHTDSDEKHVISTKEIKILIDAVSASAPPADFAAAWLRHCGLNWAAELIDRYPPEGETP